MQNTFIYNSKKRLSKRKQKKLGNKNYAHYSGEYICLVSNSKYLASNCSRHNLTSLENIIDVFKRVDVIF